MSRYLTAKAVDDLASRLTPRDLTVLKSVAELRFVTGSQLARLHFAGEGASRARAARRALLRLTDLDCLARLPRVVGGVRAGSAGFVYHLGLAGQKLAIRSGWLPGGRGRRSRSPGLFFLDHCLRVAELHTLLVEADRAHRLELLELSAEPACWRSFRGIGTQQVLKPDSFVRVGLGEWEFSYFVEVDRGTEGSRTLERKLTEYLAYEANGVEQRKHGVFPKVLWTVEDSARASVIAAEVEQLPPGSRGLFSVASFEKAIEQVLEGSDGTEAA
jgi:hypothetical protein